MEMDELLEDGSLLGVRIADPDAASVWPAYDRMWLQIVTMVRRAGHAVILLCPAPSPQAVTEGLSWGGGRVHWALLDCSEEVRRSRLRSRGWSEEWIAECVAEAAQVGTLAPTVICTDDLPPVDIARDVLAWVQRSQDGRPTVSA
jgi:hypothetical protein